MRPPAGVSKARMRWIWFGPETTSTFRGRAVWRLWRKSWEARSGAASTEAWVLVRVRVGIFEAEGYMLVRIISSYIEKFYLLRKGVRPHVGGGIVAAFGDVPGVVFGTIFWAHRFGIIR